MLLLTVSLAVGGTIALLDYQDADRFEDFHVVRGAVEVPNPEALLEKSHEDEGGEPNMTPQGPQAGHLVFG